MPSFEAARRIANIKNNGAETIGQIYKNESDFLMEQTWASDIGSKVCYIYDYFHDDQPELKDHMTYENTSKYRIDAKFIVTQYGSIGKEQVPYHIQFKPSQKIEFEVSDDLYYFETDYKKKFNIQFPNSLYIDIPNDRGVYEKWLIINTEKGNQFIKHNVLPCTYLFEWIEENGQNRYKRRMWGCERRQQSYSKGVSTGSHISSLDNASKAYLPLNSITENINYVGENGVNQRMIISAKTKHPLVWKLTKLENTNPLGILDLTFEQSAFNPRSDFIEKDSEGNIVGMWADYNQSTSPTLIVSNAESIYGEISASTSILKVGGTYKTLTLHLYDNQGNEITDRYSEAEINWSCFISDEGAKIDLSDAVIWLDGKAFNQIKIKFPDNRQYLGKILNIKVAVGDIEAETRLELRI